MIISKPTRFKPALFALVAASVALATGCSSSATDSQTAAGAGAAVSQLEAATGGSISGDCVSGSAQGASATVCADEDGNASVQATVDDTDATVAASNDNTDASTDVTTADDEGTDTSTAAAGGSATTTKPAGGTSATCGAGFPLPSGTVIVTCSDEAASVDLVATVPDPEGAYDFYLDALPKAGYKITDKQAANLAGVYGANIVFSGGEFTGADTSIVLTDIGTGGLTIHLTR